MDDIKVEAMKIVLSAVATKANISREKLIELLDEAEKQIKKTGKTYDC